MIDGDSWIFVLTGTGPSADTGARSSTSFAFAIEWQVITRRNLRALASVAISGDTSRQRRSARPPISREKVNKNERKKMRLANSYDNDVGRQKYYERTHLCAASYGASNLSSGIV